MKVVAWGKSDTGRKRDHNEDNFLIDGTIGLYAVADGMGGHQGGETASRMALEVMREQISVVADDFASAVLQEAEVEGRRTQPIRLDMLRSTEELPVIPADASEDTTDTAPSGPTPEPVRPASIVMRTAARQAGHAIFEAALTDSALRGMGTTLTAMLYHDGRMHLAHAGDSRAFLFRDNGLRQLTEDHSWIWEQVKSGAMTEAEAKESKFRHIITRSVGFERDVQMDHVGVPVQPGDCFLLCSDGMSNYIENDELERLLAATWYRRAPQLLIDLANERGGDDNITVVVVYIGNDASND
ncbi:MAG TPA: PP2C family serine/threonine-protein phosphatase [Kofleriaceae bacterium]|nr:PP2C family serine/threonine-protein phosphatase [Kofleriaceae bacterium]